MENNYCNFCDYCDSCDSCKECKNLVNGFMCINLVFKKKDESKYWIFNKEVTKEQWSKRWDINKPNKCSECGQNLPVKWMTSSQEKRRALRSKNYQRDYQSKCTIQKQSKRLVSSTSVINYVYSSPDCADWKEEQEEYTLK